jgi:plastocyanin
MRSTFLKRFPVFVAAAAMAACGGGDGGSSGGGDTGGGAPPAAAAVDPATVGTITGTVNFAGVAPAGTAIDMSGEADCAAGYGADGPMSIEVVANNGKLANVFVYLTGVTGAPAPSGDARIDQQHCRYTPHVVGVQVGQDLKITNSDNLLHNINASPTENRGFNISQPRAGIESTQSFALAEVMIPVRCDVHGWMTAYIGVVDHPYFAVSGADGSFTMSNVPAGTYTAEAWHETYGTMSASVTVTAGGSASVSFDYSADMAGATIPLGEPLVIHHGEHGMEIHRGSTDGAVGR